MTTAGPAKIEGKHGARMLAGIGHERGTTLMELIMGLVVLSVLGGIALPRVTAAMRTKALRDGCDDLASLAEFARLQAFANNVSYGLRVVVGGASGSPLKADVLRGTSSNCGTVPGGIIVRSVNYTNAATTGRDMLKVIQTSPAALGDMAAFPCFKPDGRVVRVDTQKPYASIKPGFAAGDALYAIRRFNLSDQPVGEVYQVVIPYNGLVRVDNTQYMP